MAIVGLVEDRYPVFDIELLEMTDLMTVGHLADAIHRQVTHASQGP